MIRTIFLGFLVPVFVACGDDGTGVEDIAGTYTLQSVDGEALPVTVRGEAGASDFIEVLAGDVDLKQDNTCTAFLRTNGVLEDGRDVQTDDFSLIGTCTLKNGTITMTFPLGRPTITASITGSTITITDIHEHFISDPAPRQAGTVFVYEK